MLDDVCLENDGYHVFSFSFSFFKKRHLVTISWERLYVCFTALSHLFVLLLDFLFHLPVFSFFPFSWTMDNNDAHTHRKTLLFLCRHKSVIDCSSSVCMCVYCSGSNCELFSICPYSKRARASERAHFFVVNWVFTFEDGRVCLCVWERKRLETIDESTLYWCLSLVHLGSFSLKSCLVGWLYLEQNETLTSTYHNRLLFLISNVFVSINVHVRRGTQHIKWRNSFVYCRHQWLSLILNTFSYSDFFWSHHDAESVEQERSKKERKRRESIKQVDT